MSPGSATLGDPGCEMIKHECHLPSAGCLPGMLGWRDVASHSGDPGSRGTWRGASSHHLHFTDEKTGTQRGQVTNHPKVKVRSLKPRALLLLN